MTPEQVAARIRDTARSLGHAVSMGASPVDVERDFLNAVEDLIYSLRWVDRPQFEAIREALAWTTANGVDRNSDPVATNAGHCMNCCRDRTGAPNVRPADTSQSTTSGND